jgi:glycerol-3-phosphate dehydrogenase (NAD(P)+)
MVKDKLSRVSVIGTTSWATTLGILLANNGADVLLYARTEDEAKELNSTRENKRFLPGFKFPRNLKVSASIREITIDTQVIVLAVPSQSFRDNIRTIIPFLDTQCIFVSATKGLEGNTSKRMSEILEDEVPSSYLKGICVLSGPNLSKEVAEQMPSATVVASKDQAIANEVQRLFVSDYFRVYTNDDVVGVELGGSLKNILALGAGISDGLGFGDNGKSSLITRGLVEINKLAVKAGANPSTVYGISGLGDVMATCTSHLSRNRYVGECIGKGYKLDDVLGSMKNVAEGVYTTSEALRLASKMKIDMPITETILRVLKGEISAKDSVAELMIRRPRSE